MPSEEREQGATRPTGPRDYIFNGKPPGRVLAEGAAGAMFELIHAPIWSQHQDPRLKMDFIIHVLVTRLNLLGVPGKIFFWVVIEHYRKKEVRV